MIHGTIERLNVCTMLRTVCKSKIHRATVTEANVEYEGSLTLDAELMRAAELVPYEQVHVVDVDNGARIVTYCIAGLPGSGTVCVNGAAARLISAGDRVIIISYAQATPEELERLRPKVVLLGSRNRIRQVTTEACQFAEDHEVGASPYRL
jgi:aspartate 1-decarboxylase